MCNGKPKRTQIAFDIQPDIKTRIKIACAKRNISMNAWIKRAIVRLLMQEERD